MGNIIVALLLIAVVTGSISYIIRRKKRGETCIGCPHAKQCGGNCCGGSHGMNQQK